MSFLFKHRGFALLEVMIAGTLLAGLAYYGTKLLSDQMRGTKAIESRSEITALLADIRTVLSNENSCKLTFGGQPINVAEGVVTVLTYQAFSTPPTPPIFKYPANANPLLGIPVGNGNVKILGYSLSSTDTQDASIGAWSDIPNGSGKIGTLNMLIRFYIGKHRATGSEELIRKIKMNVEVDNSFIITNCSALGNYGVDGRFLHRIETDPVEYRTMRGNMIIADGWEIRMESDRSLKSEIKNLQNIVPKLRQLRPVSYVWKSTSKKDAGLIAQEVKKVFPELVSGKTASGKLTVNYLGLTPLLLQGFQELDNENVRLKKQLNELQTEQSLMKEELCEKDPSWSFCKR